MSEFLLIIPLIIVVLIPIFYKIILRKKKYKENLPIKIIRQPKQYLYIGVFCLVLSIGMCLVALFLPEEAIDNYEEGIRIPVFLVTFAFVIACVWMIVFQINWKIEIMEEAFVFQNTFGKRKTYRFSEVEVKELSRCTRFYRNGKHIVGISFLQDNCDALEKAIYKYRKEEKKKQE